MKVRPAVESSRNREDLGVGGEAAFLSLYRTEDLKSLLPFPFIGFPDSSVDKESTSNAGDPGSVPGSGRSPAEGICYPLQYSWASLVLSW